MMPKNEAEEKIMDEKESLRLIAQTIATAKNTSFNDSGASAILWGSVIAFCGFVSFAQSFFDFKLPFDVWMLTFVAFIPQIIIAIRESKNPVKTYQKSFLDTVWTVYGISIFAVMIYVNVMPVTTENLFKTEHIELFQKNTVTGEMKPFRMFVPSFSSILLVIYAFPTLITGIIKKFKPMIWGSILCYAFFIGSLFTAFTYDLLFMGLAAIFSWLIPGIMLWNHVKKQKSDSIV
jgi:hypothetical protein